MKSLYNINEIIIKLNDLEIYDDEYEFYENLLMLPKNIFLQIILGILEKKVTAKTFIPILTKKREDIYSENPLSTYKPLNELLIEKHLTGKTPHAVILHNILSKQLYIKDSFVMDQFNLWLNGITNDEEYSLMLKNRWVRFFTNEEDGHEQYRTKTVDPYDDEENREDFYVLGMIFNYWSIFVTAKNYREITLNYDEIELQKEDLLYMDEYKLDKSRMKKMKLLKNFLLLKKNYKNEKGD